MTTCRVQAISRKGCRNEESRFWFLAGLVEGEGSVCLNLKRHPTVWSGYYVQPAFFLYQHRTRSSLLEMAKEYFGTGRIAPKPGNPDVLVYSIHSRRAISAKVVPFLEKCMALSARGADYEKFVAAVRLFEAGLHKDPWGLALTVDIAYAMNMEGKATADRAGGGPRQNPQRPYAERPWPGAKRWSDLRGDAES